MRTKGRSPESENGRSSCRLEREAGARSIIQRAEREVGGIESGLACSQKSGGTWRSGHAALKNKIRETPMAGRRYEERPRKEKSMNKSHSSTTMGGPPPTKKTDLCRK